MKIEMFAIVDGDQQLADISELISLYAGAMEYYNRQADEENYTYYFEKLAALNKQMKRIIERETRRLSSDDR